MGEVSHIQMLVTLPQKENSLVPSEQVVGGPLRCLARGEIIIIIINYENCNFFKYILVLFIRYKLNTRVMSAIYVTTDAELQKNGVRQNIPSQLNASGQYFLLISCHQSS
jgi:hypothetical protein